MSGDLFAKYCIDTCAIVDVFGRKFPQDLYPDLWPAFDRAASHGIIVSVREVYRELKQQNDALAEWAKQHKPCFRDPDREQLSELSRIVNSYPDSLDLLKRRPANADPWVVAGASTWGLEVVTSENPRSTKKIPAICSAEGIECTDLYGLFRGLGWKFATDDAHEEERGSARLETDVTASRESGFSPTSD